VWQEKKKLKNSEIVVQEDFPKEINNRRKILLPIMFPARKQNFDAYLTVDKLHLTSETDQGKSHCVFDVNNLHQLPTSLDPKYVTTEKKDNVFTFFGSLCPLSNFHPSPFKCEGKSFRFVEEYFFFKKAEMAKDDVNMQKVLDAESPAECKSIGYNIKVDKGKWSAAETNVMMKALNEKFTQNPNLKDYLMKTGRMLLAEASPTDRFWGTGVGLGKVDTANQAKWKGQNKLGQLLMSLRDQFS
jgi:ribA/ribD-fused uncharacterized protein